MTGGGVLLLWPVPGDQDLIVSRVRERIMGLPEVCPRSKGQRSGRSIWVLTYRKMKKKQAIPGGVSIGPSQTAQPGPADSQGRSGQKPGKPGPPPRVGKTGTSPAGGGPRNQEQNQQWVPAHWAPGSSLFTVHGVIQDEGRGGQNVPLARAQCSVALCPHASPARLGPAGPSLNSRAQELSQAGKQSSPFRPKATRLAFTASLFLTGSCK